MPCPWGSRSYPASLLYSGYHLENNTITKQVYIMPKGNMLGNEIIEIFVIFYEHK